MSDYLAVAGVSAILKWTLLDALAEGGPSAIMDVSDPGVSVGPPDLIDTGGDEPVQLNLFMYYASHNTAFRNVGLPSMDSQGRLLSNPPLALNLHYLLSAYGPNEFDAELLLGWAMKVFHDNPVYTQGAISDLIVKIAATPSPSSEVTLLSGTNLASQVESIKVTPESLSNEEIARLWMAFQTHYRTTTSYQVTVVLIQSTATVKSNLPVQSRNVAVIAMPPPAIAAVNPSSILPGQLLTLKGAYFLGDDPSYTAVQFDGGPLLPAASVQSAAVKVVIPPNLPAGVRSVRVIRQVKFGTPADPHPGFSSNPVQFVLTPTITTAPPVTAEIDTSLTLSVSPPVGREQRVALMVGNQVVMLPDRPATAPDWSSSVVFPIPDDFAYSTPPVALPLRVQVDGAQSLLTLDQTAGSPTFGQFLPQASISGP